MGHPRGCPFLGPRGFRNRIRFWDFPGLQLCITVFQPSLRSLVPKRIGRNGGSCRTLPNPKPSGNFDQYQHRQHIEYKGDVPPHKPSQHEDGKKSAKEGRHRIEVQSQLRRERREEFPVVQEDIINDALQKGVQIEGGIAHFGNPLFS